MQSHARSRGGIVASVLVGMLGACSGEATGTGAGQGDGTSSATPASVAGTSGGAGCPTVGFKACPNDQAVTASDVQVCETCLAPWQALVSCQGQSQITCSPDGHKAGTVKPGCGDPYAGYLQCALGTAGRDGG